MALCRFSGMYGKRMQIVLDGAFATEYAPHADADQLKVYLFGLALCQSGKEEGNSLAEMCSALGMSEERVSKAFAYWQEVGLVQIVSTDPLDVRFLPVESNAGNLKKYKTDKFHDFNVMLQSILSGREVLPNEFNEYYYFLESRHFEPEAFLCVVKYCTTLKGESVRYPYILAVAKSFADEGILTEKALSEKLSEIESVSDELKLVLKALGLKRDPDPEERKMFLKWTKAFGFAPNAILFVAKMQKGKGFAALDGALLKYFQNKTMTIPEIESFSENQEKMLDLAREITRTIGVYYQNLDNVIETYITEWIREGYDRETLLQIASYCFKKSIRTLEGMNSTIQKFYKLGVVSGESLAQFVSGVASTDQKIEKILDKCGVVRNINSWDRDFYRTWTYSWNFSDDIILLAAEKAKGKEQPVAYLNKILSGMKTAGVMNETAAKQYLAKTNGETSAKSTMLTRDYTEKELDALFDNLDDIEV